MCTLQPRSPCQFCSPQLNEFLHAAGSRAAVSTGRRKRAQSRSPVTGAAEAFESQAPRAGPSQPREPAQAEAKAAPAAQPAVTSWREGPAALQPPSGRAEGMRSNSCAPNALPIPCCRVVRCPQVQGQRLRFCLSNINALLVCNHRWSSLV